MTLDRCINYGFECLSRRFLLAPQNIFQQPKEPQNMLLVIAPYLRVSLSHAFRNEQHSPEVDEAHAMLIQCCLVMYQSIPKIQYAVPLLI